MASRVHQILGRPVFVLTDRSIEPTTTVPPVVSYRPYLPFSRLLPKVGAIVHHGGIGTCSAALAAGIPQLIVPLAFDQFDNADICEKLGVARQVSRHLLTPRRVAGRLSWLLESAQVAHTCRELAERVDPVAAMSRACEAVQGLPK